MKDIEAYFVYVDSLIRDSGSIDQEVYYVAYSPVHGEVRGRLKFADGSVLEFYEEVVHSGRTVQRKHYRYHYMREGRLIFRYDTAPHYPNLSTCPYHKHTSTGRVIESSPVSLKEVLAEIATHLEGGKHS